VNTKKATDIFIENKYQLVFDETIDNPQLNLYLDQCHESTLNIDNEEKEDSDSDENKVISFD